MRMRRLNEQGIADFKQFLNSGTGQPVPETARVQVTVCTLARWPSGPWCAYFP